MAFWAIAIGILSIVETDGALLKSNDQQEEIIICGGIDLTTDKERETMKKESGLDGTDRIVNGEDAIQGQFPYQVLWNIDGTVYCGGTIYKPGIVISAAHCCDPFKELPLDNVEIIAGELDTSHISGFEQTAKISKLTIHPDYDADTSRENNICLLYLTEDFEINDNVKPIELQSTKPTSTVCITSGWGSFEPASTIASRKLQFIEVPLLSDEQCAHYLNPTFIPGSEICTYQEGKDTCRFDGGGPLVCNDLLTGVVGTFGASCAAKDTPRLYANIEHFVEWIESETQSSTTENPSTTEVSTTAPPNGN